MRNPFLIFFSIFTIICSILGTLTYLKTTEDHVEVIGEFSKTGEVNKETLARMNSLFIMGLQRGYRWVEVRGGSNGTNDILRTSILNKNGFSVLRLPETMVTEDYMETAHQLTLAAAACHQLPKTFLKRKKKWIKFCNEN